MVVCKLTSKSNGKYSHLFAELSIMSSLNVISAADAEINLGYPLKLGLYRCSILMANGL
jgi:hypothetical protein